MKKLIAIVALMVAPVMAETKIMDLLMTREMLAYFQSVNLPYGQPGGDVLSVCAVNPIAEESYVVSVDYTVKPDQGEPYKKHAISVLNEGNQFCATTRLTAAKFGKFKSTAYKIGAQIPNVNDAIFDQ